MSLTAPQHWQQQEAVPVMSHHQHQLAQIRQQLRAGDTQPGLADCQLVCRYITSFVLVTTTKCV